MFWRVIPLLFLFSCSCSIKIVDQDEEESFVYIEEIQYQKYEIVTNTSVVTNELKMSVKTRKAEDWTKFTNELKSITKPNGEQEFLEFFDLITKYPRTKERIRAGETRR